MVVLAYSIRNFPVPNASYNLFTGQVELSLADNAEIDIGQLVYDEHASLDPEAVSPWGYVYAWKAQIFQDESNADLVTSFASTPPRYKFGHLTVASNAGIVWNDVLTFEDQVTPNFRANFYTDNPNPGDGFPFGTIPLGDSNIGLWLNQGNNSPLQTWTYARASYLNTFLFTPAPYIVRIAYSGYLSFNALDIASSSPKPYVVIYP